MSKKNAFPERYNFVPFVLPSEATAADQLTEEEVLAVAMGLFELSEDRRNYECQSCWTDEARRISRSRRYQGS